MEPTSADTITESTTNLTNGLKHTEAHNGVSSTTGTFLNPNAWLQKLPPMVLDLIYWRDTQKSGIVYGSGMAFLLLLRWMSLISVVSYMSLFALTATMSFRIYKNVMQAIQKTQDGHPFKEFLEMDVTIPEDKVKQTTEQALNKLNCTVSELRRLFLVEDFVDSLKFGVMLWCFTYIGAWFNSSTLIILAYVGLFTLPKVYEINQTQIDQYIDLVRTQFEEIQAKVRGLIPLGGGSKEKAQ